MTAETTRWVSSEQTTGAGEPVSIPQADDGRGSTVAPLPGRSEATTTGTGDARGISITDHGTGNATGERVPSSLRITKTSRINPDDPRFIRTITAGVAFAGLVAFAISFVALMEVAAWLGLPEWMYWSVPAFMDTGILVYAGSVLIHKARGERTWPSWLMLGVFTGLSIVANTAHALAYGDTTGESWQPIIGAVIAGMVPVAVFTATEQLSRVAVEDPISRRRELQAEAEWHAEQADRERNRLEMEAQREHAEQEAEIAREEHQTRLAMLRAQRDAQVERASVMAAEGQFELPTASRSLHLVAAQETHGATSSTEPSGGRSAGTSGDDLDELAAFVAERTTRGEETSGADLAREFGFSDKTGRRRLAKLREERPDVFTEAPADDGAAGTGHRES
ncbi:DUF2637 domain-containing protein [Brevibacterium senegalense]|uniref:DUF2637 domain-containing protein n=1 Tax=Brevibacterium senegalense TaxID=1033736 RepID=UPI001FDF489E|nr:DUF2637 domain-containing protein [Brevibacterium senegalense]